MFGSESKYLHLGTSLVWGKELHFWLSLPSIWGLVNAVRRVKTKGWHLHAHLLLWGHCCLWLFWPILPLTELVSPADNCCTLQSSTGRLIWSSFAETTYTENIYHVPLLVFCIFLWFHCIAATKYLIQWSSGVILLFFIFL